MRNKIFLTNIFLILAVLFILNGPAKAASDRATVQVSIHIPIFQELSLESNSPAVKVKSKGSKKSSTEIDLDDPQSPADGKEIELDNAVSVNIKSNINWRLIAEAKEGQVTYVGNQRAGIATIGIKVEGLENETYSKNGYQRLSIGDKIEIAQGNPNPNPFTLSYKIELPEKNNKDIEKIGSELVYTLMDL